MKLLGCIVCVKIIRNIANVGSSWLNPSWGCQYLVREVAVSNCCTMTSPFSKLQLLIISIKNSFRHSQDVSQPQLKPTPTSTRDSAQPEDATSAPYASDHCPPQFTQAPGSPSMACDQSEVSYILGRQCSEDAAQYVEPKVSSRSLPTMMYVYGIVLSLPPHSTSVDYPDISSKMMTPCIVSLQLRAICSSSQL